MITGGMQNASFVDDSFFRIQSLGDLYWLFKVARSRGVPKTNMATEEPFLYLFYAISVWAIFSS